MVALLTPSAVKLAHVFENHEHSVCDTPLSSHFHELDWDCEFYKFKLNNQFKVSKFAVEFIEPKINTVMIISYYEIINVYQKSKIYLRGPPALV